jgi:DNA replication protein DnaC
MDKLLIERQLRDRFNELEEKSRCEEGLTPYEKKEILSIQNELRNTDKRTLKEIRAQMEVSYEEQQKAQLIQRYQEAKIPSHYLGVNIHYFPIKTQNQKAFIWEVQRYMDNATQGQCFTMIGGIGTGKSYQAAAILENALAKGKRGLWINNQDFLYRVRDFSDPANRYFNYEYIVIDDFLAHYTPAQIAAYFNWFEKILGRVNLIITTNWDISQRNVPQVHKIVNLAAIYSRLSKPPSIVWNMWWEDLRTQKEATCAIANQN